MKEHVKCLVCGRIALSVNRHGAARTCGAVDCVKAWKKHLKEECNRKYRAENRKWPCDQRAREFASYKRSMFQESKAIAEMLIPRPIRNVCKYCGAKTTIGGRCTDEQCRLKRRRAQYRRKGLKAMSKPLYRARMALSANLISAVRRHKCWGKKITATFAMLGYTQQQFKQHIDSLLQLGMTWGNFGKVWEIDHIKPVKMHNIQAWGDEEMKKCWALDNLQPLWATTAIARAHGSDLVGNREKGASYG